MNQQTKALVSMVVAALIMFIVSVAVYLIGIKFLEPDILAEYGLISATAIEDWEKSYFILVRHMGLIAGGILLFWTALTHWVFNTSSSTGVGKRWFWMLLGIIILAVCALFNFPMGDGQPLLTYNGQAFKVTRSINLLFGCGYCLFGYWGGSILVTSDNFRYTPLLAFFFR